MAALTLSDLAVKLAVEGCIAHVGGQVQGKMPIAPVPLTELERADIKLKQGGNTLFYPLAPSGVFLDMHGPVASVWFTGPESSGGLAAFEAVLKRTHPRARQLKDTAHPRAAALRVRSWEVDVGAGKLALVEADYPAPGKPAELFLVRVTALTRKQ
jgi:hypothetical protein